MIEKGKSLSEGAFFRGLLSDTVSTQRLRIVSGLVMVTYVTTHFLNHALGLRSLAAMESGQKLFVAIWRSFPGTVVLYLALAIHVILALVAIYRRERFSSMRGWEMTQLVIGLLLPLVIIQHVIGTRIMHEFHGLNDQYTYTLLVMWKYLPYLAWLQSATLVLVWIHGCIGMHFWLRLKPGYTAWKAPLLACAIIVPTLGLLGFIDAGLTVLALTENPDWELAIRALANSPSDSAVAQGKLLTAQARGVYVGLIVFTFVLRGVRIYSSTTKHGVSIRYDNGQIARISRGTSVLDASRLIGLPHASVCGGRGRCSTCRVRVGGGSERLPLPDEHEQKVLARVGAPQNVRLACQLRPVESIEVVRLLPPAKAGPEDALARPGYVYGEEKEIAVLFADIRGFTRISEQKLPYDVVFILNRYFSEMGQAVESAGGRLDKFVGDGVMALFGIEQGPRSGARNALMAARKMTENLDELNASLGGELNSPLKIGIGIHVGQAIVGEMGYGSVTSLTAIGDTVNIASRLEAATKELDVPLVVSGAVSELVGESLLSAPTKTIRVPGREESLIVHLIHDPRQLDIG